jgi:hypothetical protein
MSGIIRIRHSKDYSIISNIITKDSSISARAKGIYFYLMTLPDDWKLYKKELYQHFSEGQKALDSSFKELEQKGYITKVQQKDKKGHYAGFDYTVYEKPISVPPKTENRKQDDGNRQLLNTNKQSINNTNTEKSIEQVQSEKPTLFKTIQLAFENKYGNFSDYGKEGKAINSIIKKAKTKFNGDHPEFIFKAINEFWKCLQDNKVWFHDDAFLPSKLSSRWDDIIQRMMKRDKKIDNNLEEIINEIKF